MARFAKELDRLIKAAGKKPDQVARLGHVDRAYLSRLLSGEKCNPSAETIIRLWIGIVCDASLEGDADLEWGLEHLFMAAMWTSAGDKLLSDMGGRKASAAAD